MCPKLRDWEVERVPKIDEIWMLACIKNSMQNGWFGKPKFKQIVKKTVPKTMYFSHAFFIDSMCCARTAALQGGNEMPM